jgi:hypothetical protein
VPPLEEETLLDELRSEGCHNVRVASLDQDVEALRRDVRRIARRERMRIRTRLSRDGRTILVWHIDHIVTDAQLRAFSRVVETALSDHPVSYKEAFRAERRADLRVVTEGAT